MPAKLVYKYSQALILFLIVFFLSAIVSSQIITKGEMVTVPDLTGKTMVEARSELTRKSLSLQEKGVEFNDRWERGKIIFQEPPAGSKIRTNKTVKIVLSGGSEMAEIPNLVGRSLEAAAKILAELGLEKGKISQIHTDKYAAGRIIAQDPSPSPQKIKRLTPINFLVSQGEIEQKYLMPDLIGKKAQATIARLGTLGFKVADVRYAFYPGLDAGIIIKQFPPHGYGIAKRNLITVEVSR
jgi:beta-lactam-binding protein with PASTA domain